MIKNLLHIYSGGRLFIAATSLLLAASVNTQAQCTPPSVVSRTDSNRCGPGTVLLKASPSAGSINWYANATGGSALGTGNTFTTPSLSATTTYYAAAAQGSTAQTYFVGLTATANYSFLTQTAGWGAMFTVNSNCTLDSVTVYPTGSGTITMQVLNPTTNAVIYTGPTVSISGTGAGSPNVVPVLASLTPGNYKLGMTSTGVSNLGSQTTGSTMGYPFSCPPLTITSGTQGGAAVAAVYYWFYNWRVTAGTTCESTRLPVVATIKPIPTVNIGNDTTICPGITYNLNAGNAGGSFAWNTGATTQSITVNTAGTYSVLATVNGCSNSDAINITAGIVPVNNLPATTNLCSGETANLNAGNSGSTFLWTPGGATTQTINVTTGGSYQAKVTSVHGCIVNSTTNVVIRPLPVAHLGNDTSICEGDVITLDAGNPGYSYDWSTGATTQTIQVSDSAIYEVTITTPYDCKSIEDKKVSFLPSPRVEGFNFIPQFYEGLGTVKFSPLAPVNVLSYEWDFGDGSPTSTQVNPSHRYAAGGDYTVSLKVFNGCGDYSISLPINVDLTTGIIKLSKDVADVSLYPNPAKEFIRIEQKNSDIRMEEVVVYNIVGSVLYRHQADNATRHQLSVATFAPGMYTISIRTNKGFVIRKFQVQP